MSFYVCDYRDYLLRLPEYVGLSKLKSVSRNYSLKKDPNTIIFTLVLLLHYFIIHRKYYQSDSFLCFDNGKNLIIKYLVWLCIMFVHPVLFMSLMFSIQCQITPWVIRLKYDLNPWISWFVQRLKNVFKITIT